MGDGLKVNNKGFTLIELIAMMVILGILMIISVPNIAGIIKNNREIAVAEDFNRFVNSTKTKFNTRKTKYPRNLNSCVIISLDFADTNEDLKKGMNGGYYSRGESFVVVRKEKSDSGSFVYKYYVRLVEIQEQGGKSHKYEIPLTEFSEFTNNTKKYVTNLPPSVDLDLLGEYSQSDLGSKISQLGVSCAAIEEVY